MLPQRARQVLVTHFSANTGMFADLLWTFVRVNKEKEEKGKSLLLVSFEEKAENHHRQK